MEMDNTGIPKISIITPCYNAAKYMGKMLASVFAQTFQDFELIMINDGSTDDTPQMLETCKAEHPDKVKVFHKENGGQSSARNMGLDKAVGEYIVFWDADDYADVDYLMTMYTAGKENNSEMVLSGSHYVDENGNIIENLGYPVDVYPDFAGRRLSPHGKMYSREFLNRHNIRFANGKLYEDNPFNFMAMFLCRNQVILPCSRHYQVIHLNSTMSSVLKEERVPFDAIEQALQYVNAHKDEVNDYSVYEFTVLSFMTYFIFLGNREHMQAAHKAKSGYKNTKDLIRKMCDFTQRVIPRELPGYYHNSHVGLFKEKNLELRWRAGTWLFTRLLKTHTLKLFAMIYYSII